MKYYEGHESVYRRLRDEGHSCWDRTAFDAFCMRPWLEQALERLGLPAGARILEIGCGAGPIACFVAERGYDVVGLDISPTAIAMARKNAADRGLGIQFDVADVIEMAGAASFDLVVDGHCLHCIVHDEERRSLLAAVARQLRPGGALVIETMARHPDLRFDDPPPEAFLLDDDGILWCSVREGSPGDPTRIGDTLYRPTRRVLTAPALSAELLANGFVVEHEEIEHQELTYEPWNYRAIARPVAP